MPKRATNKQVLKFANAVREAGGGDALSALMPGNPGDANACLIARNLNFECSVQTVTADADGLWMMVVGDKITRDRIADKLKLRKHNIKRPDEYAVILPVEIGWVARDFDAAEDALGEAFDKADDHRYYERASGLPLTDEDWRAGLAALTREQRKLIYDFGALIAGGMENEHIVAMLNPNGTIKSPASS